MLTISPPVILNMKTPRFHLSIPRPGTSARFALAAALAATLPAFHAQAVDIIKANNITALNLDASWTTVQPTGADIAVWDSTVTAANTTALGADLSWQGIRIANPTGNVQVNFGAGQTLTLGTAGIDMSAATVNLNLMKATVANTAGTLAIGSAQTWSVTTGRTLSLFSLSNSANQRLSGSGNITVTGPGTVDMLVGDLGSTTFAAGNGNDTYTGNWTINGGAKVLSLRNGTHAWGQGTITLDNGTISQQQGNWSFSNNITIGAGGGTITNDSSGTARYLNLTGVISGSGALAFNSLAAMTTNEGHILTGTNTHTGTMLINPNATVRIGGNATTTTNSNAAGTLGSIDSTVAITNNGILGFGRTDAHTIANAISGTGVVRLGRVGGILPTTQVVTMSGTSTYTGATQVNAGRLHLTGSLTSAITVLGTNSAAISGTGSTTGLLTTSAGTSIFLAGGGATASLTSNGVTFSGVTTARFLAAPVATTTYDVLTFGGGTVTNPANLSVFAHGTLTQAATKFTFLADGAQTRTWDGVTGTWVNGGAGDLWQEGDQDYYDGDTVTFSEPGAASTVTLSGLLQPASVTVNNTTNQYTFTGTAGTNAITGAASLTKENAGTLAIATQQTYTGGTTIDGGVLDLTGGGGSAGVIRGTATVNSGAILRLSTGDATGFATDATRLSVINLVGGTLDVNTVSNQTLGSATINLTGGHIIGIAGSNLDLFANGSAINTLASATTSTISIPTMNLRQNDTAFTVANGAAAVDLLISSNLGNGNAGNHNLIKNGAGTMQLTGNNTFTGTTTINDGTLEAAAAGALGSTPSIAINNGGTLLLGGSGDRINDGAAVTLNGGTFNTGGFSETAGSLTLSLSSTIDFGGGASILTFASADTANWTGGAILSIINWSGTPVTGGGTDRLVFSASTLSQSQLDNIHFFSDSGVTQIGTGTSFLGSPSFEIVPVPEPSTVFAGLGLLGLAAWRERRNSQARRRGERLAVAGNVVGSGVLS